MADAPDIDASAGWAPPPWAKYGVGTFAVLLLGLGSATGKDYLDDVKDGIHGLRLDLVRLEGKLDNADAWRASHEGRPHEATRALVEREAKTREAELRSLEGRLSALEVKLAKRR